MIHMDVLNKIHRPYGCVECDARAVWVCRKRSMSHMDVLNEIHEPYGYVERDL